MRELEEDIGSNRDTDMERKGEQNLGGKRKQLRGSDECRENRENN